MIDNKGLQVEKDRSKNQKGQIKDRSRYTTIDTKILNTNNTSKNCPTGQILDFWRELLPELPQPRLMTGHRQRQLAARWNSGVTSNAGLRSDSIEFWRGLFEHIKQSDFLMGRSNGERPFRATFDFVIKQSNFTKIIEGNYHK